MDKKLKRRLRLLDDLLDYALRSECGFFACNGPGGLIIPMKTCARCSCITRAMRMGLVVRAKETYIRGPMHGDSGAVVSAGYPEQFSVIDGEPV